MSENNKKEVKMILTKTEHEKFCKEAESCKLSHSNYMKVMWIFGKMFICRGKEINPKMISERIMGLSTYCNIFKNPVIENSELNFLLKQNQGEVKK